jgi:Protein of unknown function (DUF3027)
LARDALDGLADPAHVGDHVNVVAEEERVATHFFECLQSGYRGWSWAVTVARAPRSKLVTVDEAVLLPSDEALLPPEWLPWTERLRKGDLRVGDLLPTDEDDARLEPGWNADMLPSAIDGESQSPDDSQLQLIELVGVLDLARRRVLSPIGMDDAVDRWLSGDYGPESAMAVSAPDTCATCGFRVALPSRLGQAFGVCANEIAETDGHLVSLGYGCGAHSEAVVVPVMADLVAPVIDELGYEMVEQPSAPVDAQPDGGTVRDDDPGEELGHG